MQPSTFHRGQKHGATIGATLLNIQETNHSFVSNKSPEIYSEPTLRSKLRGFPWRVFLIISLLPLSLAPIITLSATAEMASQNYIRGRSCYPNGLWKEAAGATWRIMDSTYFFTPNLSFGSMTFTQVKVIDIAWDLIVGRGGQMCLAWVNWRVFNEWLVWHLERYRTSYKMYTAVALQTTSLTSLGVLAKEFLCFGERNWGRFLRWLAMFSMLISTLYVLAFPTLMAAMTGYITTYEPYMEDYDRNLIEWAKVDRVVGLIPDAKRIGFNGTLLVRNEDEDLLEAFNTYRMHSRFTYLASSNNVNLTGYTDFASTWTFNNITIDVPALGLNVTLFLPFDGPYAPLRDIFEPQQQYYAIDGRQGTLYNSSYIKAHSSCKPSETYQWGFSYIFLFMISIFNFLWSVIMVCMWLDIRRGSRMYKSGRRPGLLRSVLDLSSAIREELGTEAENMGEADLRKQLTISGGALVVPVEELKVSRTRVGGLEASKRTWKSDLTKGSHF